MRTKCCCRSWLAIVYSTVASRPATKLFTSRNHGELLKEKRTSVKSCSVILWTASSWGDQTSFHVTHRHTPFKVRWGPFLFPFHVTNQNLFTTNNNMNPTIDFSLIVLTYKSKSRKKLCLIHGFKPDSQLILPWYPSGCDLHSWNHDEVSGFGTSLGNTIPTTMHVIVVIAALSMFIFNDVTRIMRRALLCGR